MRGLTKRRRFVSYCAIAAMTILVSVCGSGSPQTAVSGELIETFCWAKMRINGPAHASCGIQCAKRGIPVGVVDAASGKLFVLLPGRDKMSVPPELIASMGRTVTIRGEIVTRSGANFLTVQTWEPQY